MDDNLVKIVVYYYIKLLVLNDDIQCCYLMMEKMVTEKKVIDVLRKNKNGITITELVKLSDLSRSTVRVALARLEGQNNVTYKNIGMAKVYVIRGDK